MVTHPLVPASLETAARHLPPLYRHLHLPPEGYSLQTVNGQEHRIYDNRIHLIRSDLTEVDISGWLKDD